jgi:hypothetical protein
MSNARFLNRVWRPATAFFLGLLIFFLVVGRSSLFRDPGTFWHIVVGDRILAVGFFDTDPFSFTRAGQPWIPNQWLAECSMAILYKMADFDGLLLYAVAALAAAYALVGARFVRAGFHWLPTVMLLGLAIGASSHNFHARPHVLTIALLAWTFAKLLDVENGGAPVRSLWWLVPGFLIWTNWHGGMLGGLATLGITIVGWLVFAWLGWPSPIPRLRLGAKPGSHFFAACSWRMLANSNRYSLWLAVAWGMVGDHVGRLAGNDSRTSAARLVVLGGTELSVAECTVRRRAGERLPARAAAHHLARAALLAMARRQ